MKDLFENYRDIPKNVLSLFNRYPSFMEGGCDYEELTEICERVEELGYTFDFYLDAVPFGLRPLGEI